MTTRCAVTCLFVVTMAAGAQPSDGKVELSTEEKKLLDLINAERKKNELPALTPSPLLTKVARAHSANMARQGKMAHELDGKNATDRVKEAGYKYLFTGENVAAGYSKMEKVIAAWMDSEPHRKNILGERFTQTGVGIVRDDKGTPYYTQVFAKPR